ncbi:hypothetical protein DICPUDRAFT_152385 [Dictyostelium purpureum]|uniref:SMP domain-containing protein n=1 Tax=Dictyostelium purpureum TaxID=5786 RepID=F0ZL77_DICPU|nr:uncharacterized protein DICPUDRAFT_152385 [Dictyostelium purpureum]EGC35311.1 hypothetical protein DICPUDRAFT_152385 [Dictyostelium purpureum]|eukprot:XP_003288178.1 hypothetical protein DICPUDRAFT_152385 [Dictyostelium purpureum]
MSKKMSSSDASRIQSAAARQNGGSVPAGSFASRAQSAGAKNANSGSTSNQSGKK